MNAWLLFLYSLVGLAFSGCFLFKGESEWGLPGPTDTPRYSRWLEPIIEISVPHGNVEGVYQVFFNGTKRSRLLPGESMGIIVRPGKLHTIIIEGPERKFESKSVVGNGDVHEFPFPIHPDQYKPGTRMQK